MRSFLGEDIIEHDRNFAKRGDIFITAGLFKELESINSDDRILAKKNRPVLIVSNDNSIIIRCLALSSSDGKGFITEHRDIQIPAVYENEKGTTYIDTSQIFTINCWQLRYKLAHVSDIVTDTAIALNLMQNINSESVQSILQIIRKSYPDEFNKYISYKLQECKEYEDKKTNKETPSPSTESVESTPVLSIKTYKDAYRMWKEWKRTSRDSICDKYKITKQRYATLKCKAVKLLLNEQNGFSKKDWVE